MAAFPRLAVALAADDAAHAALAGVWRAAVAEHFGLAPRTIVLVSHNGEAAAVREIRAVEIVRLVDRRELSALSLHDVSAPLN
jgi:hypothetical protein